MPRMEIDGKDIEFTDGETILEVARRMGIKIPTLCHLDGFRHHTSCMVCVVFEKSRKSFLPSCTARAENGMLIDASSEPVMRERKAALELLLSEHAGDCEAPCSRACPLNADIPSIMRAAARNDFRKAGQIAARELLLPEIFCRTCPAPCEKACRRKRIDAALHIRKIILHAASAAGHPPLGEQARKDSSRNGQEVAVIGAGPAGLAAAEIFLRAEIKPVIYEATGQAGGALQDDCKDDDEFREALDAVVLRMNLAGAVFKFGTRVGEEPTLDEVIDKFPAVVVAAGSPDEDTGARFGLATSAGGTIRADKFGGRTSRLKVFAAGAVMGRVASGAKAAAQGRRAALAILEFLHSEKSEVSAPPSRINSTLTGLSPEELGEFLRTAPGEENVSSKMEKNHKQPEDLAGELSANAAGCLHCDCRAKYSCRLRDLATEYGASQKRYSDRARLEFAREVSEKIIFEPGKCISCGKCVRIAESMGIQFSPGFIKRSYDLRVSVPFGCDWGKALGEAVEKCVEACPVGALSFRDSADLENSPTPLES